MSDFVKYTIALAGNPNCGKTTLFNRLTKSNQKVGNWGGVTVEKKVGRYVKEKPNCACETETVNVVDLPGIYSLTPYSAEEIIAHNFIIDEKPDLVVNIIDATNLERNLYLTFQLKKLGCPMVIALNMMDEVEQNGTVIDFEKMSQMIGVPIVPISAVSGKGFFSNISRLMKKHSASAEENSIEKLIQKINALLDGSSKYFNSGLCEFSVSENNGKMNETDETAETVKTSETAAKMFDPSVLKNAEQINYDEHSAEIYAQIEKIVASTVSGGEKSLQQERSEKIDRLLTHRWLGIPIFLSLMGVIFYLSFGSVSSFFSRLIETFFGVILAGFIQNWFDSTGTAAWMSSLMVDGVIAGVSGVLVFIPQLLILFFFLTLLEDTGYLARVAFLMERIFDKIGLTGKSFIPMMLGFGCSVPALIATRVLDNEADRKTTILITPFMSCSARLPIYILFVGTFFAAYRGMIMLSLYVLGILVAVFSAWLFKKTIFKGPESPFIMELPPYRLPDLHSYLKHVWEKIRGFIIRAGTIILLASIVIWFAQGYDFSFHSVSDTSESIIGIVGSALAPLFEPLGFGDWRATVSLLTGLVSKELVVSVVNIMYTPMEFRSAFAPASALAFMVFTLLYLPCVAALVTTKRELNSMKWAAFAFTYQTATAYLLAFAVYRIGLFVTLHL